jgi:NADPH-dependent glutamate synthase beta subunit-like oxidoreductase
MDQINQEFDAVFLGLGAQGGRALPAEGADNVPNVVTATAFLKAFNDGRLKHVGKRVVVVGGGDTSMDVATVARRLGHIENSKPTDWEDAIAGQLAQDAADISRRQGAEVTLTTVYMMASKQEIEHAESEGIASWAAGCRSPCSRAPTGAPRACASSSARPRWSAAASTSSRSRAPRRTCRPT